jgi:O-antigen/teichoic acid export membrane protein
MGDATTSESSRHDASVAVRNGIRLAGSLIATWMVALVVRLQLPRHLGPEQFGRFNFTDALTAGVFSFLSFGVGTYIMREVATRPGHASDFFGGLVLIRSVLGVGALLLVSLFMSVSGRPDELQPLVFVFGLTYLVVGASNYLSNILQAATKVKALANVNVLAKFIWGGGLLLAIHLNAPLYVFALPNLVSELLKLVVLVWAAREAIDLRFRLDYAATKQVLVASLPFYAHGIAVELGARVDVTTLEFIEPGPEVGWYSAANNFAALALLVSPVVGWVVMPLLARAHSRSEEEFFSILRVSIRAVLLLAIPGSLLIALGADFWVSIAFGDSFAPSANAVRVLAPMFIATYLAILLSVSLVILQRAWTLTLVSILSLVCEVVLIPPAVYVLREQGDGGAATGGAVGLLAAELLTALMLLRAVGRRALDRFMVLSLAKCALLALAVWLLDSALRSLGPVRLVIDMLAYALGALALRAVTFHEVRELVALVRHRRAGSEPSADG